jgi:hypothetical protein
MQTTKLYFMSRMALILAVAVMVACSWLRPLDSIANKQVDAGLKRALISFATARALNGVISVAQGTELKFQFIGGVNVAVGQILDPVNDLVEQFSDWMLTASIAFGIQKMLLSMGAHWLISLLLTGIAIVWTGLYFLQRQCPAWLAKLFVVLLMMRFAIPVVVIGSDLAFQKFMAPSYKTSQQSIATTSDLFDTKPKPAVSASSKSNSWFQNPKGWFGSPATDQVSNSKQLTVVLPQNQSAIEKIKEWIQEADPKSQLDKLKQSVEETTENIIKLMVIFVLQTLIIPIALLWILYGLARGLFERGSRVRP